MEWAAAPGHTPGHTVFIHRESGVLLAGDAISILKPSFTLDWTPNSEPPRDNRVSGPGRGRGSAGGRRMA